MVAAVWLRGSLQASRYTINRCFSQLPRNAFQKQNSLFLRQIRVPRRKCFHPPGATNLARDAIQKGGKLANEEMKGKDMLKNMVSYIWPKGNNYVKKRVVIAITLLVGAKLLNISVPFLFKYAVDELNQITGGNLNLDNPENTIVTMITALVVGYGAARMGAAGFNELRNAVFARVSQHSIRRIAQNVFKHLHNMGQANRQLILK